MRRELYLSTLADNGAFALEFYLFNDYRDDLVHNGIEYCNHIIDSSHEIDSKLMITDEDKYEILETIQHYYKIPQIAEFSKMAYEIRTVLFSILDRSGQKISEKKIRSYQNFFNETSMIFLAGEFRKIKLKEEMRYKYRF